MLLIKNATIEKFKKEHKIPRFDPFHHNLSEKAIKVAEYLVFLCDEGEIDINICHGKDLKSKLTCRFNQYNESEVIMNLYTSNEYVYRLIFLKTTDNVYSLWSSYSGGFLENLAKLFEIEDG